MNKWTKFLLTFSISVLILRFIILDIYRDLLLFKVPTFIDSLFLVLGPAAFAVVGGFFIHRLVTKVR